MTDQEIAVRLVALSKSTTLPLFNANGIARCLLDEIRTRPGELPEQTVQLLLGIAVVLERHHVHIFGADKTTAEVLGVGRMH